MIIIMMRYAPGELANHALNCVAHMAQVKPGKGQRGQQHMTKAIVTYITSMVIIFALTCAVSANSDCDSVSQNELNKITTLQAAIDENNGGWIAGETTVSGLSEYEKMALSGARIAALPPGATVVRPARTDVSATRVSATGVTAGAFDWRDKDGENWVTPVRSQGSCGSCWAFSAIGVVESAARIYANNPDLNIDLSEQHLVSDCCSAGSCNGGWPDWALDYVRDTGVPDEDCTPYNARDSSCNPCSGWTDKALKIDGYVYVQPTKEDFKAALQQYGPMSVVLTVPSDWYYYRTGVYSPTQSREDGVGWANHAVILVGWDDSDDCWIIKNSWGAGWGENGYARVKYGDLEQYNYAYAVTGVVTDNNGLPEAAASATPLSGDAPLTTTFAGTGTDSDGTIVSYKWEFGDGQSIANQNPTYTYTIPGTYSAILTVTDNDGAIGTDRVTIEVMIGYENQPPNVSASATPLSGDAPLLVTFISTGNDCDGEIESYEWEFGDGESSADQNPTHLYTVPGTYTATITVTDDCNKSGADNVTIKVTQPGDGAWVSPVAATASSTHIDKYAPEKAIDGRTDTHWFSERHTTLPCWIQFDLGAVATVSKVRTVIFNKDVPITFDVQVSTDGTDWTTVAADFTITEADTAITVPCSPANARYVRLQETVLSRVHGQCTEFEVYVEGANANQPPEATASATLLSGEAPLTTTFAGTGTDSDGTIVSYGWEFGDGESSADQNPTHLYTVGTYTATLTVTDEGGAIGTDRIVIEVAESSDGTWVSPVAATASSTHIDKYAPEKAIDGRTDTHWFSERHTALPCWIQFDLGEITTVSKVRTVIFNKDVPITFDVRVSTDGTDWTTVAADFTITEADTYVTVPCDPANARYVRLQETVLSGVHGQCTEFEVYAASE